MRNEDESWEDYESRMMEKWNEFVSSLLLFCNQIILAMVILVLYAYLIEKFLEFFFA